MRLVILFLTINLFGCASTSNEPMFDTCVYMGKYDLYCYPVNKPGEKEYTRTLKPGTDLVMTYDDYLKLKLHHKELHESKD